jgi:hypothetical protein
MRLCTITYCSKQCDRSHCLEGCAQDLVISSGSLLLLLLLLLLQLLPSSAADAVLWQEYRSGVDCPSVELIGPQWLLFHGELRPAMRLSRSWADYVQTLTLSSGADSVSDCFAQTLDRCSSVCRTARLWKLGVRMAPALSVHIQAASRSLYARMVVRRAPVSFLSMKWHAITLLGSSPLTGRASQSCAIK